MAERACDMCDFVSPTPQGLGRHKSGAHGIPGARSQSKKRQRKNGPPKPAPKVVELPTLGERVQITLLAMDPETGEVTLGLNGKWRAVLR